MIKKLTPEEIEAQSIGYEAGIEQQSDLSNPYDFDTQHNLWCAWDDGYQIGTTDLEDLP